MDTMLREFTVPPQRHLWGAMSTEPDYKVRVFADDGLQAAIDRAIARSDAKHGAVVAHADGKGASLSIVARKGDHWTVAAAAFKPYNGKLTYGAEVVYSW